MARIFFLVLIALLLLAFTTAAIAQTPGQPTNPGQAPAGQAAPDAAPARGGTIEYIVAFSGAALALLVVCYPSRRY